MNKKYFFCWLCCACLLSSISISAQTDELVYSCDFEQASENAQWNMASGSKFTNHWVVGGAESEAGSASLYVSGTDGANTDYNGVRGSTIAYRVLDLRSTDMYRIEFDWKCASGGTDALYVCWVNQQGEIVKRWATNNNAIPSGVKMYGHHADSDDLAFEKQGDWQHASFLVRGRNYVGSLVFYWTNNCIETSDHAGCIDNIRVSRLLPKTRTNVDNDNSDSTEPIISTTDGLESREDEMIIDVYPQKLTVLSPITLQFEGKGNATFYTETGAMVEQYEVTGGEQISAPAVAGIYLLRVVCADQMRVFTILVTP